MPFADWTNRDPYAPSQMQSGGIPYGGSGFARLMTGQGIQSPQTSTQTQSSIPAYSGSSNPNVYAPGIQSLYWQTGNLADRFTPLASAQPGVGSLPTTQQLVGTPAERYTFQQNAPGWGGQLGPVNSSTYDPNWRWGQPYTNAYQGTGIMTPQQVGQQPTSQPSQQTGQQPTQQPMQQTSYPNQSGGQQQQSSMQSGGAMQSNLGQLLMSLILSRLFGGQQSLQQGQQQTPNANQYSNYFMPSQGGYYTGGYAPGYQQYQNMYPMSNGFYNPQQWAGTGAQPYGYNMSSGTGSYMGGQPSSFMDILTNRNNQTGIY